MLFCSSMIITWQGYMCRMWWRYLFFHIQWGKETLLFGLGLNLVMDKLSSRSISIAVLSTSCKHHATLAGHKLPPVKKAAFLQAIQNTWVPDCLLISEMAGSILAYPVRTKNVMLIFLIYQLPFEYYDIYYTNTGSDQITGIYWPHKTTLYDNKSCDVLPYAFKIY